MKRILVGVASAALLGAGLALPAGTSVATGSPGGDSAGHGPGGDSAGHGPGGDSAGHGPGGDSARQSAPVSARAAEGTGLRQEPNTLTRREAVALQARQQRILQRSGLSLRPRANGSISIPVDFHGITDRRGNGFVSRARIHRQIRVLNRAYGGRTGPRAADTPFRFHLSSVERVKSRKWYTASAFTKRGLARLREMRRELRVGNAKHLNIYSVGPKFELLGFATLPSRRFQRLDGVVIWGASMPGGNANLGPGSVYNRGDTATHEVGHWLNLLHTFSGGCGRRNDFVTDTPRQKAGDNIFEEDPTLDTCGRPGGPNDPVRNFMNYVDDPFMNQFTRGQRERMDNGWYIRQALAD